jgi:putative hydrolase of the HAD superfamily
VIKADVAHIKSWIFDLDHTLYPYEAEVMHRVSAKMTHYVARLLSLSFDEAKLIQKQYLRDHGTTLAGLMKHHATDPYDFMDDVHDVSLEGLSPDYELNRYISSLRGQKIVFTNADSKHSKRLLDHLEMAELFDAIFHLEHANLVPKPNIETYRSLIATHNITATQAIFFEDTPRNLLPAKTLGMMTVLIGPHALENTDDYIDFRAHSLKAFFKQNL